MTANKYFYAVWRRKASTAVVKLFPNGKGELSLKVNGKAMPFADYFGGRKYLVDDMSSPFDMIAKDFIKKYDAEITLSGGGVAGQAGAVRLAFARVLTELSPDYRLTLKPHGLLKRDQRIKERKKPGLKKARKSPTWSKR